MANTFLNDFLGAEHMEVAHNVIFSIGNGTAIPALELMDAGIIPGLSTGAPSSTAGFCVNQTLLPLDFSTDSSTEGRLLGDDSMWLTLLEASTQDPMSVMAGAVGLYALSTTGGGGIIIIIVNNDQPNSYVEKNAAAVYESFHGAKEQVYQFPAVITESPAGHNIATKVFGKGSLDRTLETLDVWEALLQEHINN